jgi:hypothetical protein
MRGDTGQGAFFLHHVLIETTRRTVELKVNLCLEAAGNDQIDTVRIPPQKRHISATSMGERLKRRWEVVQGMELRVEPG